MLDILGGVFFVVAGVHTIVSRKKYAYYITHKEAGVIQIYMLIIGVMFATVGGWRLAVALL